MREKWSSRSTFILAAIGSAVGLGNAWRFPGLAAKHGGGKVIDAYIRLREHAVVIYIRDYGPGIPEDEIPLVKKKFYKGSSKARGTGIGLAVCDEIVELHGGTLTLENAPEGGTLVTVRLPVVN